MSVNYYIFTSDVSFLKVEQFRNYVKCVKLHINNVKINFVKNQLKEIAPST